MEYADYSFYTGMFHGEAIEKKDFPRLAFRASRFLDYYTRNRAKDYNENNAVKYACCAVAEAYQVIEKTGAKSGIASESVGSYSVSYTTDNTTRDELANVARQYLATTGLLYRGRC